MSFFSDETIGGQNKVISHKAFGVRVKIGIAILAALLVLAVFGPLLAPRDPANLDYRLSLKPPSLSHPFGTDLLGRDMFGRVAVGARISLSVGLLAVIVALLIGLPLGALAGYFGGWLDSLIMRLADVFLAFPMILGALLVLAVVGPGLANILLALGILGWAYMARLFRSSVVSVKQNDYVLAARAAGAGHPRLLVRHIFPNAAGPVIAIAIMNVGVAIMAESVLSFLGVGLQPPNTSWGYLLAESAARFQVAPWLMYFPGLALTLAVLGFTLAGEGLRAALSPGEEDNAWR